jgi:signal transduction histidine kinase/ActR/RegA family two-component response regulator
MAGARPRFVVWALFAVLGALLAAYIVFLAERSNWGFSPWLDGWLVIAFELTASLMCIAAGIGQPQHRRRAAFWMGVAALSWTVGDLLITLESLGGGDPSVPSWADLFYLGFYPPALVAVLLFTRGEIRRGDSAHWLDGAIAALGMGALDAVFAFHALAHVKLGLSAGLVTNLAYPIGDLLLLGLVAGSALVVSSRLRTTFVLLAIGMGVIAAGDTFNLVADTTGTSTQLGMVMNAVAWPTALMLFAMAMWAVGHGGGRFIGRGVSGFLVPGLVTCSSLGILVVDNAHSLGDPAVGLATATVVLAGIRLAFRPALRQAREQLVSSEERSALLFSRNPMPVLAYDRSTLEIVAVSDRMIAKYDYSRDELYSMTIKDLWPPGEAPRLSPADRFTEVSALPVRHVLKDGTIIDVEVTSTNVDLDGRECRIALFSDVTERNKAAAELSIARDEAVEASNMKSAFLANVSHEIRTPMNGVIGMNELLLDTALTDEQREYATQVSRSGEQMLLLINDILDISKLEAGSFELDVVDFDLHATIEESCSLVSVQAIAKGLRFAVGIAPEVPPRVRGDGRRLRQVLLNLVSNAVKFTTEGEVSVTVSAQRKSDGAATVRLEVADSGIGIDPASLERMFEPFTQADASTTRNYGGTGLGLAIARELVTLMGGTISAESESGRGSTFAFELDFAPALAEDQPPEHSSEVRGSTTLPWSTPPLVLVAEDSPINQIVAVRALERCGARTEVVATGVEALQALAARRYDAVLMDCQMPEMDGYEATVELRRRENGTQRTPVIAMTAHAMDGDRERCLQAGMDDYITKPMRHTDLAEVLLRWIPITDEAISQAG